MIDFSEFNSKYQIYSDQKIEVGRDIYYTASTKNNQNKYKVLIKDFYGKENINKEVLKCLTLL